MAHVRPLPIARFFRPGSVTPEPHAAVLSDCPRRGRAASIGVGSVATGLRRTPPGASRPHGCRRAPPTRREAVRRRRLQESLRNPELHAAQKRNGPRDDATPGGLTVRGKPTALGWWPGCPGRAPVVCHAQVVAQSRGTEPRKRPSSDPAWCQRSLTPKPPRSLCPSRCWHFLSSRGTTWHQPRRYADERT